MAPVRAPARPVRALDRQRGNNGAAHSLFCGAHRRRPHGVVPTPPVLRCSPTSPAAPPSGAQDRPQGIPNDEIAKMKAHLEKVKVR